MAINFKHPTGKMISTTGIVIISADGGVILPAGNSAARLGTAPGTLRFNSVSNAVECYYPDRGWWKIYDSNQVNTSFVNTVSAKKAVSASYKLNELGLHETVLSLEQIYQNNQRFNTLEVDIYGRVVSGQTVEYITNLELESSGIGEEIIILSGASVLKQKTIAAGGILSLSSDGETITLSAPAFPSNISYFLNDRNYISETSASQKYVINGDLSALSQFNNDAGYITTDTATSIISQLYNDVGYITELSANTQYVNVGDLSALSQLTNNVGYLTSATQSIYATSAYVNNVQFNTLVILGQELAEAEISALSQLTNDVGYSSGGSGQIYTMFFFNDDSSTDNTWMRNGTNGMPSNQTWSTIPFNSELIGYAFNSRVASATSDIRVITLNPSNNPNQTSTIATFQLRFIRNKVEMFPSNPINVTAGHFLGIYLAKVKGGNNPNDPTLTLYFRINSITDYVSSYNTRGNLST